MIQAFSKIIIHQTADDIWRVISRFEAGCRYLHGVVDCVVEGEGIGALRTLVSTASGKAGSPVMLDILD